MQFRWEGYPKATFQAKGRSPGRRLVESVPPGARVQVDSLVWPEPNFKGFADAGTRWIRVKNENMEPAKKQCEVRKDSIMKFTATLAPTASSAICAASQ